MNNPRTSSSEPSVGGIGPVITIEGMPGAGKTTAVNTLDRGPHLTVGEYVSLAGATIPISDHPSIADDDAHQHNWILKHRQIQDLQQAHPTEPVIVDRDWLSALAYAASIQNPGQKDNFDLLARRALWAERHLAAGALAIADTYVILHVDPAESLRRRAKRIASAVREHPWSDVDVLLRLNDFYNDPPQALHGVLPALSELMQDATWHHLDSPSPESIVEHVQGCTTTTDARHG